MAEMKMMNERALEERGIYNEGYNDGYIAGYLKAALDTERCGLSGSAQAIDREIAADPDQYGLFPDSLGG